MEIIAEKIKLMTNNTSGIKTDINVNGQKLETVEIFKYLGSVISDEGSKPEILSRIAQTTTALTRLKPVLFVLSRIAQTTAALTRLKPVWNDRSISLSSKTRLMHSLVTSTFLYACESWTLTAELQREIEAMKMRCYLKILHISYKDHVINKEVRAKIKQAIGSHEDLLTSGKRQKLQTVTSFKYLGSVVSHESFKPEILSRIALTTAARLKPVWDDRSIPLSSR